MIELAAVLPFAEVSKGVHAPQLLCDKMITDWIVRKVSKQKRAPAGTRLKFVPI